MSETLVKRGRSADVRARQLELKQTLLEHPDVPKVTETVIRSALDNNHKNKVAAQKILMDRMLPISTFEKAADSREEVNIVIHTLRPEKEPIEAEGIEQWGR